ncbi:MFS general substrate transporter [Heliocybe sulcata]|uniref:MFS general substrate transporter n=1 Tax=Heliocybe sulcata TaxID=5364 RepID=A0A5C3N6W1_9AGAM|nr:MFS general substrate transporter [Heliocybe sulcata]
MATIEGEKSAAVTIETLSSVPQECHYADESTLEPPPDLTEEEERKLWRKVDLRLMPILSLMQLCSFLDRGNAKLQGLVSQLHLVGNEYNIALTMYFIPYALFECPANLVLKKLRPSRWLPGITITWGIIMTLMGLIKSYQQLVGIRICLGIAEAGLFPGVIYYLTFWYPRHMLQYRVGLFWGAATVSGAFSGLLAFGISFMSGTEGMLGWSWIFILEGIGTVLVGVVAAFVLVDFPATAKFLTPRERAFIVDKQKYDISSVGEEERFAFRYIWAAFKDWQVLMLCLINLSVIGPLYGISLFLPFGYSTAVSQLLTVPPYVFATIVLLIMAVWSDRIKKRSPFIFVGLIMSFIGFLINITDAPVGVKYLGTFFCVGGCYSAFTGVVSWLSNNLAGQYKRAVGVALQIGMGGFAGAIASNMYRTQDAPRYVLGHGLELMLVGLGLICVPLTVLNYIRINAQRDTAQKEMMEGGRVKYSAEELKEMGDKSPDFRYTI